MYKNILYNIARPGRAKLGVGSGGGDLIVVVGPTASGKSTLGLELALALGGEIICADSQTIRRGMDIGTAKPSQRDQKLVKHHLLDIIDPYDAYNAAKFKQDCLNAMADIRSRGKLPIIVGGTGLYIDAVIFDFNFADAADPEKRKLLNQKSVAELQIMHLKQDIDLPKNRLNKRHLVRSLESGGLKALDKTLRPGTFIIGLDPGTEELNKKIETRVNAMLQNGFVEEVKSIVKKYGQPPAVWDAIGYKVIMKWMDEGGLSDDEYVRQALITATRHYAKRQRSWFKRNPYINWLQTTEQAQKLVTTFLQH